MKTPQLHDAFTGDLHEDTFEQVARLQKKLQKTVRKEAGKANPKARKPVKPNRYNLGADEE